MDLVLALIFIAFIYFLPTIIAHNKKQAISVFMLNLFLGWTFLGWVLSLVWACYGDAMLKETENQDAASLQKAQKDVRDVSEVLEHLSALKEKGVLTAEEFEQEKVRVLNQ